VPASAELGNGVRAGGAATMAGPRAAAAPPHLQTPQHLGGDRPVAVRGQPRPQARGVRSDGVARDAVTAAPASGRAVLVATWM